MHLADEERSFLISEELQFRTGELEGEPTFIWRDLEGDVDEFYEFVATGTNAPTRAFFETCMYRAMYERKYKRSADNTTDSELAEFIWQCVTPNSIYVFHQGPNRSILIAFVDHRSPRTRAKAKAKRELYLLPCLRLL